eukprot:3548447-Prorocentrum_lima.AAC.1
MTSSLVGSEMCIRDSSSAATTAAPESPRPSGSALLQSSSRAGTNWRRTVSYTHLTLPTICSV